MIRSLTIIENQDEKTGQVSFQVNGDLPFPEAAKILVIAASAQKSDPKKEE